MKHWNPFTLTLLAILILFNIAQCFVLVKKASKGTDFTVFYNTGQLLDAGAGAELYRGKDETTDWLRTIPPFGQMVIAPFAQGTIKAAAIGWGLFNLALLAATAGALRAFARRLDSKSRVFGAVWTWSVLGLLVMAPASIQVGQFSVLFTACWVFSLALLATKFRGLAGAPLAIPIAIKIYPALLLAVPLLARRPKFLVATLLFVALWCAAPFLIYGARTPELSASFWRNAIASSDGRVAEARNANSPANQGLDVVALRYGTSGLPIHARFPHLPHADLPAATVMNGVSWVRVIVVLISLFVGWRFWRRGQLSPLWGQTMLVALMCAALYVLLPGAKTRYAIYEFPAFWPLLVCALAARRLHKTRAFWGLCAFAFVCLAFIAFTPSPLRVYGFGLLAALALWAFNCLTLWRWSDNARVPMAASNSLVKPVP